MYQYQLLHPDPLPRNRPTERPFELNANDPRL